MPPPQNTHAMAQMMPESMTDQVVLLALAKEMLTLGASWAFFCPFRFRFFAVCHYASPIFPSLSPICLYLDHRSRTAQCAGFRGAPQAGELIQQDYLVSEYKLSVRSVKHSEGADAAEKLRAELPDITVRRLPATVRLPDSVAMHSSFNAHVLLLAFIAFLSAFALAGVHRG